MRIKVQIDLPGVSTLGPGRQGQFILNKIADELRIFASSVQHGQRDIQVERDDLIGKLTIEEK